MSAVPTGLVVGGMRGFPTTEVVGYSLSSLAGLNVETVLIPLTFAPGGTQCGNGANPVDFCPWRDSMWRRRSSRCLSSLTGLNVAAPDPRASPASIRLRRMRCRPRNADDFGDAGCIPGVQDNKVARAEPSTMSTASTASTRIQENRRGACATRQRVPVRRIAPKKRRRSRLRRQHDLVQQNAGLTPGSAIPPRPDIRGP